MLNWEDREYVNARKKIFKNLDTGEILNLEIQDDPSNIVTESETPLSSHCLNMAQQELVDDMGKIYIGMNITADTVAGYGRIKKVYGKTTEEGTEEKSSDNPYKLKCVGDDINLFNKATQVVGELIQTNGTKVVNANFTHSDYIRVNANELVSVVFTKKSNAQIVVIEYDINKNFIKGNFYDFRTTTADDKYTITTSSTTSYIIAEYRNDIAMGDMKVVQGTPTPWSPYGYGTVQTISKNGSNSSSNIVYVDKPLCSVGDIRDKLDYTNKKITRRCGELVLNGTESWKMDETVGNIARFTSSNGKIKSASHFICDKLKVVSQTMETTEEECIQERSISKDNMISIIIKRSRLSSVDANGFKTFLASNPIELIYELATPIVEDIDCSNKIAQYDGQTTVHNRDGAELEVELTNNKAISGLNEEDMLLEEKIAKVNSYSTEEIVIGKWFGKKLYRKTVTGTYTASHLFNFSNVETMVNMYGTICYDGGTHQIGAHYNENYYSGLQYNASVGSISFWGTTNYTNQKYSITLEYTKTTD